MGQVKKGIPVWMTGEESKFPGMPYIIFPGNVGEVSTLKEIVEELIWKIAWLQVFVYASGKFQLRKSFNDITSKFLVCFEQLTETLYVRACLKNHSRNLHAPLCGIFCPNSVAVARYGALIRTKSPTNCDAHLAGMIFQTRSNIQSLRKLFKTD